MKAKPLLVALAAIVVLVVIGASVLMGRVDNARPGIQTQLQQKLNRRVTLGHLSLHLLPLEIKVDGFSIGEAAPFPQDRPFASAKDVFVSVGIFSLIGGNPAVRNLRLDKPQIELIRNAQGVWNYSSLGKNGTSGGNGTGGNFSLDDLKITDGQVGYTDQFNKQDRAVYDHIDLQVSDFAPGKQFGVDLGIHFPGEGSQLLEFKGKVGPVNIATENALPPVNGHLSIQQVTLAGFNRFASGAIPPDTNSVATGEADINTLADVIGCKGNLKLENTILNGAKMDYAINSTYNVEDDLKQKKLLIKAGSVQLGPTTFTASGNVDMASTPAQLNLEVKTDNSSITELAKLAGGLGVGFSPAYNVAGKVSADVTAKGPASLPLLNGSIRAQGLQASGGEIKTPVSIPEIDVSLTPDSIVSNTFTASSGSTSLAIAFSLLQYTKPGKSIDATVKTDGANVAELLNIAKAYGLDATQGMTGDGKLSINVHAKGPLADSSALNYAGTATISDLTLTSPQLKKPLKIASANANFSQNSVSLDNLSASLGATTVKGNLSARNFAAPEVAFNLSADNVDVDELQNISNAPPSKPAKNGTSQPPSLLLATTGNGMLAAASLKSNDIVLKNVNAKCQLDKGLITLSPLSADIFGGKASGSLAADMRPATPQSTVKIKLAGVDANSLLSAVSSVKNTVYGSLAADTNLRFALAPGNDLTRSLNGVLSFNLTNGVIKNVNLMGEINKIGKLLGTGGGDSSGGTELKKFLGTMNITNGVATTQNLTGALNAGTITGKGSLNLVSQDIDMHMTAALNGASSQPSGGVLSTVLATGKGGLVVPVLVTGNMAHPNVTPDTAEMAKLKLSNLGGKGLGGALGGLLGQNPADAKTKKSSNPLGGLLDQIKK